MEYEEYSRPIGKDRMLWQLVDLSTEKVNGGKPDLSLNTQRVCSSIFEDVDTLSLDLHTIRRVEGCHKGSHKLVTLADGPRRKYCYAAGGVI